ncbi:hypothetical protein B484DRAFT_398788, partial [Ochromonadaceae sp. CCMP2298]
MQLKSGRSIASVPARLSALPRVRAGHVKPFVEDDSDSDKENIDPRSEDDERYPLTQPKVLLEDRVIADLVMEYNVNEDFRAVVGADEVESLIIPGTTNTAQVALATFQALINTDALDDDYVTDFAETLDNVDTFDLLDAAVVPLVLLFDWGQRPDSPKGAVWHRLLQGFESAAKYQSVVDHFLAFHEAQDNFCEETLSENVGKYFEHERLSNNRKSSTLRSRFSALKKFFLHTGRGEIAKEQTLVESNFA